MSDIRTNSLSKEEKTELTNLLAKLQILPHQGQVILHCNNGRVAKVEPHVMIACSTEAARPARRLNRNFNTTGLQRKRHRLPATRNGLTVINDGP